MMGTDLPLSELQDSPCLECLIKTTCSKSYLLGTACDKYKEFVKSLVHLVGESQKDYEDKTHFHN